MKTALLCICFCLLFSFVHSQDSTKIKRIDSIVSVINRGEWKVEYDSIHEDQPQLGLKLTTYVTAAVDSFSLRKFINNVRGSTTQDGVTTKINTYNIFYFDHGELIKVEELGQMKGKKLHIDWYYDNGAPLHSTFKSEKSTDRAFMLLKLGNQMVQQYRRIR